MTALRILASTTHGSGHLEPMVPVLRALEQLGHRVVVAAPQELAGAVARAGLRCAPFADRPAALTGPVHAHGATLPGDPNPYIFPEVFGRISVGAALPGLTATFDAFEPDLVVRDMNEYASALLAERHGVPVARIACGLQSTEERMRGWVARRLDEHRAAIGLDRDPQAAAIAATPMLTTAPRAFEDPRVPGAAAIRHRPDGVVERRAMASGARPFVYVAFGSMAPLMDRWYPSLYRAAMHALSGLDVDAVIAVGAHADPAALGAPPPNVVVERWVDQAALLARADVTVTHGGFGSAVQGLRAGAPQVVLPLFADQPYNAARLQDMGAGIRIAAAPEIGPAVTQVLEDDGLRARVGRVAEEARRDPPASHAAEALVAAALGSAAPAAGRALARHP